MDDINYVDDKSLGGTLLQTDVQNEFGETGHGYGGKVWAEDVLRNVYKRERM